MKRQEHDCRLLVASLSWTVVEVYDDNDMSASDRRKKRKNYHRMLDDIESGHIDAVVTGTLTACTASPGSWRT